MGSCFLVLRRSPSLFIPTPLSSPFFHPGRAHFQRPELISHQCLKLSQGAARSVLSSYFPTPVGTYSTQSKSPFDMDNSHHLPSHPLPSLSLSELEALAARFLASAHEEPPNHLANVETQEDVREVITRYIKMATMGAPPHSTAPVAVLPGSTPVIASTSSTPIFSLLPTTEENSPAGSRASSNILQEGTQQESIKSRGTRVCVAGECQ